VPSVLPAAAVADAPTAHECTLQLALGDASAEAALPFLPESLWAQLLVKCVQYATMLSGGGGAMPAKLTRDWAQLPFSGQPFMLRRDEAAHAVRVLIADAYPTPIAEQLCQLASEVCSEWMPGLRASLLVRSHGTSFELREVASELRQGRCVRHPTTLQELRRDDFVPWVAPETEQAYDVMIGYRKRSEKDLAQLLFHILSSRTIGGEGRQVKVFLDRERLQMGQRWDFGFVEGLARSRVVVPLISYRALEGTMEELDPENGEDWVDHLHAEWTLAIELHAAGRIQAIQPILIGKQNADGTMSNFFTDGSKGRLKDAVSHKTLEKVREYAKHINLELSAEAATRTIKGTLETMLTFQTTLWWDVMGGPSQPVSLVDVNSPFPRMCAELIFGRLHMGGGGAGGGAGSSSSGGAGSSSSGGAGSSSSGGAGSSSSGGAGSSSSGGAGSSSSGGGSDLPAQLGQVASAVLVESLVTAAWAPFLPLLKDAPETPDMASADKMLTDPKHFVFGSTDEFRKGLVVPGGLTRSMKQEFEENDGGKWLPEYMYVVCRPAIAVPDVEKEHPDRRAAMARYEAIGIEAKGKRDLGNDSKVLANFCDHADAVAAQLTHAEVAALRLYTGPPYRPMNEALRAKDIRPWATTITLCCQAILKLSYLSKQMRVYRGVKEYDQNLKLADAFLNAAEGEFAGGVELAFMSTTPLAKVALQYSGKGPGSIFVIDFGAASRGAAIRFLSQCAHGDSPPPKKAAHALTDDIPCPLRFPHEDELLFPPMTFLECAGHSERNGKRLVMVKATVSTAMPDTSGIQKPDDVPGGGGGGGGNGGGGDGGGNAGGSGGDGGGAGASEQIRQTPRAPPQRQGTFSRLAASVTGAVLTASGKVRSGMTASGKSWSGKLSGAPSGKGAGSEAAPSEAVETLCPILRRLIDELKLKSGTAEVVRVAGEWCEEKGVDSAEELKQAEMESEYVAALKLKEAKAKILLKRLAELPAGQASGKGSRKKVSEQI
jgi:hypothetical protein